MVQYAQTALDASFAALADPTRRSVIARLAHSDASISYLADTFDMTLTGMKKHIGILERAGLVTSEKVGRVRTCRLRPGGLAAQADWLESYRKLFEARFAALDRIVMEMKREETDE